ADVRFVDMGRVGHFMIRRRGWWEALTSYLVVDALLAAGLVGARQSTPSRTASAPATNDQS
ncbi:MAG: hypothetical protein ACRDTP_11870, partial [Mycobacteriales bacterium]